MPDYKVDLNAVAREEMVRNGFQPDFPAEALAELQSLAGQQLPTRDMRELYWSSIDNSTSKDLDQIEWAERRDDCIRVLVAIADVDAMVRQGSAIDAYAQSETTSVYTAVHVFPMLPEQLSTDMTSLAPDHDRAAIVIDMTVDRNGGIVEDSIYSAAVRNRAQLSYGRIGAWLDGQPQADPLDPQLADQLRLQEEAAKRIREARVRMGALEFNRFETPNPASMLIEDFMIAANETMAKTLARKGLLAIRRVVREPERWPRIVQLAAQHGFSLPAAPDPHALNDFLRQQNSPDVSLSVIKLMGPGQYVVVQGEDEQAGHFGLAAHDYTHSTAPNRRFADLVTQRLIKASLSGSGAPYTRPELESIAEHCTEREDAARKVERAMQKRADAFSLRSRVGQEFRAVITGVNQRGVFARTLDPAVEGRVIRGEKGLDVGDKVKLKLIGVDPRQGFIDFST